ncbi:MAG: hypothetical protein GY792_35245 [Gammaproteobacteria bacterium]|nr:hypothetical protein [Gammaproteobacteria bacterium]
MSNAYLLPEDVSTPDTLQVLEFLNAAESAEQIDAAIEIPEQMDIGPQIARRLIEQREALGRFSNLDQVYAIPYIGPQRFTQIVISLSAARPPQQREPGDPAALNRLSERIDQLEQRLRSQPGIRLHAINPDALLGQESTLLGEVRSAEGQPLIDQPVTFVTTWGVLRGRHGLQPVSGTSITVRSDHLGLCKVHLRAALGENLSSTERDSLTHALTLLGEAEGSPRDNLEGLTALARQYRAAGNGMLRKAIDTLSKRYADSTLQDAPVDSLARWPLIQVSVFAMLPPESDAASTEAPGSMINLQQRNWFYAWLWAFRQLLESESQLGASLADVSTSGRSGRGVLSDLYNRVDSFVSTQHGIIGHQLGEHFAADRLNGFLTNGLKGVNTNERTRVLAGVSSGAGALKGAQSFGTLSSSRTELQLEVDAGISKAGNNPQFGALDSRLNQIERDAIMQDDMTSIREGILQEANSNTETRITNLRNTIDADLKNKADRSALTALSVSVDERFENKADVSQIQALQRTLTSGLATKANVSDIESLRQDFNTKLDTKADATRISTLENLVAGKADATSVNQLQQELTTGLDAKADKTALTELSKGVDTSLASKADATAVNRLQNDMKSGLDSKADKTAMTELSKDVDTRLASKADVTTVNKLDRDISALNTRTNTINTDLTKLDTRVKTVDKRVDRLGTNRPGPVIRR